MKESLMFFIIKIKLDIAFTISITSLYMKILSYLNIKVIKAILKYIKSSKNRNIVYERR